VGALSKVAKIFNWRKKPNTFYNGFFEPSVPLFTSFGRDIFASDIIKTAIHRIAEAISKCTLKSVVVTKDPHTVKVAEDDLNILFCGKVNQYMTMRDFLYKVAFKTIKDKNCFIFPAFDEIAVGGGKVKRVYTGLYPLEVTKAEIYGNGDDLRVELSNGISTVDLPYSEVIHIRHDYGLHPFLGGDANGGMDKRGILQNLDVVHSVKEAVPKSLEASLAVKGFLTFKGTGEFEKMNLKREEIEKHLTRSKYGFLTADYGIDFSPIDIKTTDIPPNVLDFIVRELLYPFGVSLPIMAGSYNDDEYSSFYQTAVEGLLIAIAQSFTATLLTSEQIRAGHEIKAYDRLTQSLSIAKRIQIAEMTKDDGLLEADERRELLGYEPNGQPTRISLNYIDKDIINEYQLKKAEDSKKDEDKD
jgi:hypothetical protein